MRAAWLCKCCRTCCKFYRSCERGLNVCCECSGSEQTSSDTADVSVQRLAGTRPTPPSRLILAPDVSRDLIEQQQQRLMLSWRRMEGTVDERRYMHATRHDRRQRTGLVVCMCAGRRQDTDDSSAGHVDCDARQSHVVQRDIDDKVTTAPCHTSPRQLTMDDLDRCSCSPADVDDDNYSQRQTQLMVDYDIEHRTPSTRTWTLDSVGSTIPRPSSDECSPTSADRHLTLQHSHQRRQQLQLGESECESADKKRLTLSCMLADFSGLLRRVRRLRLNRTPREHETRV